MRWWNRLGRCPCGRPHIVTIDRNGVRIIYWFITCETHGVKCKATRAVVHGKANIGASGT